MNSSYEVQQPPHDSDAERGVLGSLMFMPSAIDEISSIVSEDSFWLLAHSRIFRAIADLFARNCQAIDVVTVAAELDATGALKEAGGAAYLAEIIQSVPHAEHVRYYAKIVQQHSMRRNLIEISQKVMSRSYDKTREVTEIAGQAIQKIEQVIGHGSDDVRLLAEVVASLKLRQSNPLPALSTGLPDLDAKLRGFSDTFGGLHPSQLIIVGARPSMGKTAFGTTLIEAAADADVPSLFIALEMDGEDIASRIERTSRERLHYLAAKPVYIEDRKFDIDAIVGTIRIAYRRKGVRFVVIDYLGLIEVHANVKDKYENITRRLKLLAKDLRIPIVVLAQLNRDLEKREDKRPQLSDLRMSGAIEQDADVVMFLYRHEVYYQDEKPGVCEVIIRKQRNGPTGAVEIGYLKEQTRFVPRSEIPIEIDTEGLFQNPVF